MNYFTFGLLALILCSGQMCGTPVPTDTSNDVYDTGSPVPSGDQTVQTPPPVTSSGPKVVSGPGFSVYIPAGFDPYPINAPPLPLTFYDSYSDYVRALVVSAQKVTTGGQSQMQGFTARVQSAQVTDSGDFLLIGLIESNDSTMMDALAAYALLANGDLLCVEIDAPAISTSDQLMGMNVFRTVNLSDTDGRQLEQLWRNYQPKLLDGTDTIVVLDDLTAWGLPYNPTPEQTREFSSWQIGDAIHSQTFGSSYYKQYELVHVGHWAPVSARYFGMAVFSSISSISTERDEINLANGNRYSLYPYELPAGWQTGHEILVIEDGVWTNLIDRTIGQAFRY